uniref:Alpha/beta hydrolase n=1 Tax=Fusarium camptoceras TaxID=57143 RepID=A0A110AQ82_9HYPO|nr:alpha/beta hydrolase [Fusarium camptoceras]
MFALDPVNAAFFAQIDGLPCPHQMGGHQQAYDNLEQVQKHDPAPDIEAHTFQVGQQYGPTSVTIFRLKTLVDKPVPMVFYTHGGGWIMGSAKSFAVLMEDLARRTGAAIVFPDYTRAPHQTFPYPFEQTYEVLDYMVRHTNQYQLLSGTIALAGDSVGGHMAIAMMQMSLERKLPAKIGQLVLWAPVTETHKKLASYKTFKEAPFLPEASMDWMIDSFLPNKKDRETALASPLTYLPDHVLAQFPPTIIFLSTIDPLLDEGVAFGYRLQKNGVDASIVKAEGQMHAFCLVKALRDGPTARAVMEMAALRLKKVFPSRHESTGRL